MQPQTVLVVIDDLFFLSKVRVTLEHLGLAAQVMTDPDRLVAYVQETPLALAVVDLTLQTGDAVSLIQAIRAANCASRFPILAFGAHVAVDIQQQACQAGADQVVAKSEFSRRLPDLIRQHTGAQ